jgi:hypothetical protein
MLKYFIIIITNPLGAPIVTHYRNKESRLFQYVNCVSLRNPYNYLQEIYLRSTV